MLTSCFLVSPFILRITNFYIKFCPENFIVWGIGDLKYKCIKFLIHIDTF